MLVFSLSMKAIDVIVVSKSCFIFVKGVAEICNAKVIIQGIGQSFYEYFAK